MLEKKMAEVVLDSEADSNILKIRLFADRNQSLLTCAVTL